MDDTKQMDFSARTGTLPGRRQGACPAFGMIDVNGQQNLVEHGLGSFSCWGGNCTAPTALKHNDKAEQDERRDEHPVFRRL